MSSQTPLPSRRAAAQKADILSRPDGPTQHTGKQSWGSRPRLARILRWLILLTPSIASFLVTFWTARRFPPDELGVATIPWWIGLFSLGVLVLLLTEKLTRKLLPLAALFRLSLVFPDAAPSRFAIAMRTNSTRKLERRLEEIREDGLPDDSTQHAELMLELVAALSLHDRLTRGHCERVRAYTDMIAEEMKLPEEDAAKLRWAALLHDVGKIYVSADILNKEGRPTEDEWDALKSHTWKGDELVAPLAEFLGPWGRAVRNHHERWDGNGYPDRLAGKNIPLGGRIVAVADAFDVMTSARSYKEPRPASEAREEIARCAGGQFDPEVARAFLNIGLGRLRFAVGPLSWLANLGAVGNAPALVGTAGPVVGGFVATAAATVVAFGAMPAAPPPEIAFDAPTTTITAPETTELPSTTQPPLESIPATPMAQSGVITLLEDHDSPVVLAADDKGAALIFLLTRGPTHGTLSLPSTGSNFTFQVVGGAASLAPAMSLNTPMVAQVTGAGRASSLTGTYSPDANYNGPDDFKFRVCNADSRTHCSEATVSLSVTAVNDAPVAANNSIRINEDQQLALSPAMVLGNDFDVDGDALTVTWNPPSPGASRISNNQLRYTPPLNATTDFVVRYTVCDGELCDTAMVTVDVQPVDDAPVARPDAFSTLEDTPLVITKSMVFRNDVEVDGQSTFVSWSGHPDFDPATLTFTPQLNSTDPVVLAYTLCDVGGTLCDTATVTVTVVAQADDPIATGESVTLREDELLTALNSDILINEIDPDGEELTIAWGVPAPAGLSFIADPTGISFQPPKDFVGDAVIPYSACAGTRCSPEVAVTVTFTPVNDPPIVPAKTNIAGTENTVTEVLTSDILAAASDVDDAPGALRVEFIAPTPTGFSENVGPTDPAGFKFTPQANSITDVAVDYKVCDDDNSCTRGQLILKFAAIDDPPVPNSLIGSADEDFEFGLDDAAMIALAGDPDSPLGELTFTFTQTDPTLGTPSYDPSAQKFTYVPTPDAFGFTEITFTVCDLTTTTNCPSNTISLTINAANDRPTIDVSPHNIVNVEDTLITMTDAEVLALVSDVDNPDTDLVFIYSPPGAGTFNQISKGFEYQPALDYVGLITIGYSVCDGIDCSITSGDIVLEFVTVDDPPVPTDIAVPAVDEDPATPIVVTRAELVAAAGDPDTAPADLIFSAGSPSVNLGSLIQQPNGDWHFTPNLHANGPSTYPFQVCDNNTIPGPNCELFDVAFMINPVNDRPVIQVPSTTFPGTEDTPTTVSAAMLISLNLVFDPDAAPSEMTYWLTSPDPRFVIAPDGMSFSYTPVDNSTADVFLDYFVCDPEGLCTVATGEMVFTFAAVDDPPLPIDFAIGPFDEDASPVLSVSRAQLEANVSDVDTPLASITYDVIGSSGANLGTWADPGDGSLELTVTPDANGTAIYTVEACDATSCPTFELTVVVDPVNDLPVITADPSPVATRFAPPVVVVLPVDYALTDVDIGDTYTVIPDSVPASEGFVTFDLGTSEWKFTPNATYVGGPVTIGFQVCDSGTPCPTSEWVITPTATNTPPVFGAVAIPEQFVNIASAPVNFTVIDPESAAITITADTLPSGLSISGASGSYTISGTPDDPSNLGATVAFTIDASDGTDTTTYNGTIDFSKQGVSPYKGDIILTEVVSDDVRVCVVFCFDGVEGVEVYNLSGSAVDMSTWILQDRPPLSAPDANGLDLDISDNMFFGVPMWQTTVPSGAYSLLATLGASNETPYNYNGDDLWLLDGDGLIVDYVGWQHALYPGTIPIPEPELGLWDLDRAAMTEIAGKPFGGTETSISLGTLTDANTAACWEFTTGIWQSGSYVCPAADTTLTIDNPMADGNYGMDSDVIHSFEYPNY